jgi:two-component system OmpR family response regulator
MQAVPSILVVDDDPEIRRLLGKYLEGQSFRVSLAASRREMEEKLRTVPVDLVVLDVLLPDGSGLEICAELRQRKPRIPVILLTALKEDVDRIIGLELGADDYLGKPFNPRELVARIRAVLRRDNVEQDVPSPVEAWRFGGFTASPATRRVTDAAGSEVDLTGAEFDLLVAFLERPGRVLSRDQLLGVTSGRSASPFDRSIDVLMSRLRRKLGESTDAAIFKTIRNGGYQLVAPVETVRLP